MEHGFFHPASGYWQTTDDPTADIIAAYPEGTVQVPIKPGAGYTWDGVQWLADAPKQPTREEQIAAIDISRDAALAAGVMHEGTLYHADTTFLLEMLAMLQGYALGILSGSQNIRTKDGVTVQKTAAQITAIAAAVGAHRQAAYSASWAAKDAL